MRIASTSAGGMKKTDADRLPGWSVNLKSGCC